MDREVRQDDPADGIAPTALHWPDGLDTHRFVTEFWQRRPLLIRQALPGFRTPLTADELAGLALEEDTTPRLILRDAQGRYRLEHGPFEADRFDTLGARDWSLLVTDVEKHLPELAAWLAPFRFLPAWRLDDLMISYAPDGASVGAHRDEYDVFLLQASGQRRWEIQTGDTIDAQSARPGSDSTPAAQSDEHSSDEELRLLDDFAADQSWVLDPGDLLYLPPGVPHHGTAVGDDCMTWSIGFRAPAQRDVVEEFSALLVDALRHQRFEDPDFEPMQAADSAEISSATVLRFAELWAQAVRLEPAQLRDFVGRLVTSTPLQTLAAAAEDRHAHMPDMFRHADGGTTLPQADGDTTSPASAVAWTRHPFSRFAFMNTGTGKPTDAARLFVDGDVYDCPATFARRLCDPGQPDLPADLATSDEELALLVELARRGNIEPQAERASVEP